MMLVLTRKIGDSILIGDDIRITITAMKGLKDDSRIVRVGIEAPADLKVVRAEVKDQAKNQASGQDMGGASDGVV